MGTRVEPVRFVWLTASFAMLGAVVAVVCSAVIGRDFGPGSVRTFQLAMVGVFLAAFVVVLATQKAAAGRSPAMREWSAEASIVIQRPAPEVWDFIRPAESAPLLRPHVERAGTVAGTPKGVGEQQEFFTRNSDGTITVSVVEVVDERPGEWAEVRNLTGPPCRTTYRVRPVASGAELTYSVVMSMPRWSPYKVHPEKFLASSAEDYLSCVKRVLEALPRQPM